MALHNTYIPYGAYWTSPFCRWQGLLSTHNSVMLAAETTRAFLARRGIAPESFDGLVLGMTVPQRHSFYGAPWVAGLIGAPGIAGPTVAQACATSVRVLATAAAEIETGQRTCVLGLACDRTSNGPHLYYPNPKGPGGRGDAEEWVWDNFNRDPYAAIAMIETAENVAKELGIGRAEQERVALLRYQQYQAALANERAFQRRAMQPLVLREGKKTITVDADEGVHPTSKDGLAALKPVVDGGTVTHGTQTHPADGNAGMIVCDRERARSLSQDGRITIQLLGFGSARVKKGFMPTAVAPAAKAACDAAGVKFADFTAVNTHNPFAVNDIHFSREVGIALEATNRFGSPLVYGHPQGPTGLRASIELVEELAQRGGGLGLFAGCAAGDTAMAVVLRVS